MWEAPDMAQNADFHTDRITRRNCDHRYQFELKFLILLAYTFYFWKNLSLFFMKLLKEHQYYNVNLCNLA